MTFHVLSLPHTQTTKEYSSCAYTQKVVKFCKMMKDLGHTVYLYASEENEAPCDELITCITKAEQESLNTAKHYVETPFDPSLPLWEIFNFRASQEINARKKDQDFLCVIAGRVQESVANSTKVMAVEFGIGYSGVFAPYQVFESYAWMHSVYAQYHDAGATNGRNFDAVIPNPVDMDDFMFSAKKGDYYLYLGRMVQRKGVQVIAEIAKATGKKIMMAGMGAKQAGNIIRCVDTVIEGENLVYIGEVNPEQRKELLAGAKALIAPTLYIEPWGGVVIEAMASGTPVITSDWGGFTESVRPWTGFRCRTLQEFVDAIDKVGTLDYQQIRQYASMEYSLPIVGKMYEQYFERLLTLHDKGWYQLRA